MVDIHAVMRDGGADRVPAFRFDVLSRTGAAIVLRGHLGQQSVAQSQRGIAEARQLAAFQKFGVNHRACDHDLRAPGSDAGKLLALRHGQARQHLGNAPHLGARNRGGARAFGLVQAAADRGQGGCRARGRDHDSWPGPGNPVRNPPNFPLHKSPQTPQLSFARRIMRQELIGQAHRAQRQAHGVANVALAGDGQLAASASQVDHERGGGAHSQAGHQAEVNQPCLFQSRDDFDFPTRRRAHPLQKGARVAGVAQGAGGDYAHGVRAFLLHRTMEAPQHLDRIVDGLGRQESGAKDAVAQTRDLAIFVNFDQTPSGKAGDFQTDGVRSDIDRG